VGLDRARRADRGTFHFGAGEIGDEGLDLPHEGTIVLTVVKAK
jgi:hypothetical protein